MIRLALVAALLSALTFSCKRVKPDPPVRTTRDTLLVPPLSTITVPIGFDLDKIEAIINEKLNGTFLKKKVAVNGNDSLYFELTSLRPIVLTWRAPDLRYTAHLHVSARYIKDLLGLRIENEKPIEFEMEVSLNTELGFEDDWSIRPRTEIERISWTKHPVLNLGIGTINLRKPVEKALVDNRANLTQKLDEFIRATVDVRKVVSKIWHDIQQPIVLRKDPPLVWLQLEAETLRARWTRTAADRITVQAELTGKIETGIGAPKTAIETGPLPPFNFRTGEQDSLVANVLCTLPFAVANDFLARNIKGLTIDSAGYKVRVKDVEIYGTDDGLAVKLDVAGDMKGYVYFRGRPTIDPDTKTVRVEDFEFDVDSEDAVMASADWFLHSSVKRVVEERLTIALEPYAQQLPSLINAGIEKGKLGEKLDVNIRSWQITPVATAITSKDIQMILQVRGVAEIELQRVSSQPGTQVSAPDQ